VFRADFGTEESDKRIKEILSFFKSKNVPMIWRVGPLTKDPQMMQRLVSQGLFVCDSVLGMACDLGVTEFKVPLPLPDMEIRIVSDKDDLSDFVSVLASVFGIDNVLKKKAGDSFGLKRTKCQLERKRYIAYFSGIPVGTVSLILNPDVSSIYDLGVLEGFRKMGIAGCCSCMQ